MSVDRGNAQLLRVLAGELAGSAQQLATHIDTATTVMVSQGFVVDAAATSTTAAGVAAWCDVWATSLADRADLLDASSHITLPGATGNDSTEWALGCAGPVSYGSWLTRRRSNQHVEELIAAAAAMVAGTAPDATGLERTLFPEWYRTAHRVGVDLESRRTAALARVAEVLDSLAVKQLSGPWTDADMRPLVDELVVLHRRIEVLDGELAALRPRITTELDGAVEFLAGSPSLTSDERQSAIGAFLAAQVGLALGRLEAIQHIGLLVERHVSTPHGASSFVNGLPDAMLQATVAALGAPPAATDEIAAVVAPYSRAMALASHGAGLETGPASLVDNAGAGYWFADASGYATEALIAAFVAALGDTTRWPTWLFETAHLDGGLVSLDPRVSILEELNRRGPGAAIALVAALETQALTAMFLDPHHAYADAGEGVGRLLTRLGTATAGTNAVLDVISALGGSSAGPFVLEGAAQMIVPHLGSLPAPPHGDVLPASSLRALLDGLAQPARAPVVGGALTAITSDSGAFGVLERGLVAWTAATIATVFDPADPSTLQHAFWELGVLAEMIISAHLDVRMAEAVRAKREAALIDAVAGGVLDLVVAGGLAGLAAPDPWALGIEVASGITAGAAPAAGPVESVLIDGYAIEADTVTAAMLLVALLLDEADIITVPKEWSTSLTGLPDAASFRMFLDGLEAEGFPVWEWFAAPMSIGGAIGAGGAPGG